MGSTRSGTKRDGEHDDHYVGVKIGEAVYQRLRLVAGGRRETMTDVLRRYVDEGLERDRVPAAPSPTTEDGRTAAGKLRRGAE